MVDVGSVRWSWLGRRNTECDGVNGVVQHFKLLALVRNFVPIDCGCTTEHQRGRMEWGIGGAGAGTILARSSRGVTELLLLLVLSWL